MSALTCKSCLAPAVYEVLLPDGGSFNPPIYQCERGIELLTGPKRRLTPADYGMPAQAGQRTRSGDFAASAEGGRG